MQYLRWLFFCLALHRRHLLLGTTDTSASFTGELVHTYAFRVRTWDNVGNERPYPDTPDATTRVQAVTKYYHVNGQRACPERSRRVAMRQGDVVYYIHTDHLGSTSVLSDGSGQPAGDRVAYLPYGGVRLGDASTLPTDYTFTGQRNEAGLGLMHYGARFYSPRLGRFVSADTIVPDYNDPQTLNRYSYVLNRPLQGGDPTGHQGPEEKKTPWWAYWLAAPWSPDESNPLANVQIGEYRWTDPEYHQFLLDYYSASAGPWSATASDAALACDATAVVLAGIEAAAADVIYGAFTGVGFVLAGPGGAWAGLKLAFLADVGIASGSPLAGPENFLGILSLASTGLSDIFAGYTGPTDSGIAIGQDTLVTLRNMAAGFVPESNLDVLISASQLQYDLDRRAGREEGESVEISELRDVGDLLHLMFLEHW